MQGKKRRSIIFLAFLFIPVLSVAQEVSIRGQITDAISGAGLLGANVYNVSNEKGTVSTTRGAYQIRIPKGKPVRLRFSYMGYASRYVDLVCWRDTTISLPLQANQQALQEIVVEASTAPNRFRSGLMNVNYLSPEDIKASPGFLGEPDVIKVLQLKPGMQSGNEGSSGFYVRGGQADQNLILYDGAPVYNPSHLFGMFSVFSNDAIDKVQLYKGAFPAKFGGRLSSVLDIGIRPGNKKKFKVSGGTGLISSRLTLEGPILKDKVSFMVNGRRTYFNFITDEINQANRGNPNYQPIPDYYFYDLSAKVHAQLSPNDQISFTAYTGRDRFDFQDEVLGFNFLWGNKVGVLQWTHAYNPKLIQTLHTSYSGYQYRIRNTYEDITHTVGSGINDINLKNHFEYRLNKQHTLTFGLQYIHHAFDVLRQEEEDTEGPLSLNKGGAEQVKAHEGALFLADVWQVSDRLELNAGLRVSGFGIFRDLLAIRSPRYSEVRPFLGFEPRLSARYEARPGLALKAGYSKANQYIHLVSSSGASLPSNFWYPSNRDILPQIAEQYAIGTDWMFGRGRYLLSNELYYRNMENQIDFRDGAELFSNPEITEDLVFGKGWAYGNEFYIEKKKGKTTGWIGYTLSWSYRKFDQINAGAVFPSTNDRRHDLTLVLRQELSTRLSFSGNWVFCSGNVTSLPQSRVLLQGQRGTNAHMVPVYNQRNSYRMAAYHRLDLSLIYDLKPRWGEADLTLGVYNAYNRRNPYFIYFEQERRKATDGVRFSAKQLSLFPILPSLSFNYSF